MPSAQPSVSSAVVLAIAAAFLPAALHAGDGDDGPSAAEIDAAIAQLEAAETRLAGLETLAPLTDVPRMQPSVGPDGRSAVTRRADAALDRYVEPETIGLALNSSEVSVRYWALRVFPWFPEDDHPDIDPQRWRDLLPTVRRLAEDADWRSRGRAQEILQCYEGQREFLIGLIATETSADLLMRLLRVQDWKTYTTRINPHLLRILGHPEEEVRNSGLLFIGFDRNRAEMWQMEFDERVLARVLELSRSASPKERGAAVYALDYWLDRDLQSVRGRLLELARDPSEEVRWGVADALRRQPMREDVRAALEALIKDDSARVRYFAIVSLGPNNYRPELRELAEGEDPKIAEFAAGQLKKLASQPAEGERPGGR